MPAHVHRCDGGAAGCQEAQYGQGIVDDAVLEQQNIDQKQLKRGCRCNDAGAISEYGDDGGEKKNKPPGAQRVLDV